MKRSNQYILERSEYGMEFNTNCLITFKRSDYTLENYISIINTTTNTVIYNPICTGLGGTITNGNLILDYDLDATGTGMSEDDDLIILIKENIELTGVDSVAERVQEERSHVQLEILDTLNKIEYHLSVMTDEDLTK